MNPATPLLVLTKRTNNGVTVKRGTSSAIEPETPSGEVGRLCPAGTKNQAKLLTPIDELAYAALFAELDKFALSSACQRLKK